MSRVWTLPEYMALPEADPETGRPPCCGGFCEAVDVARTVEESRARTSPYVYRCKSCGELFRGVVGYHFDAVAAARYAPFFEGATT